MIVPDGHRIKHSLIDRSASRQLNLFGGVRHLSVLQHPVDCVAPGFAPQTGPIRYRTDTTKVPRHVVDAKLQYQMGKLIYNAQIFC